ncbi:MAG: DUF362 domain-containing protein [Anaerolineae bacterium]|nr:DUF362 domain-containing protein [Anaerolineae bacterium]
MPERVALVRCAEYDPTQVEAAVRRSVELLGGMEAFVQPGQRVLLKPNLVRAAPPEKAISTHPTVVAAVAKLVREVGGQPFIAESPGGPYTAGILRASYRKTGMAQAAEESGAELNFDTRAVQVSHPEAKVLYRLDLIQPAVEADVIINLPKLKTHNLSALTLAVKNLYGLVPGTIKISYHAKLQQRELFCQGLVDLLTYVKPALQIMDAVVGMEGEGPSGGDPRPIGAILASPSALAMDIVAAALVGFDPLDVLTTRVAVERGLTSGRLEDVELVGDSLEELRVPDFRKGIEAELDPGLVPRFLRRLLRMESSAEGDARGRGLFRALSSGWVWKQLVAMPYATEKCVGCGYCAENCPVQAIQIVDGRARMDGRTCIRCYCCHELCPYSAIELRRPLLGRLLMGR